MNDDHAAIEALRDRLRNGYDMRLAAREAHAAGAPVAIIAATIRRTPQTVYQWLRMDLADILAPPKRRVRRKKRRGSGRSRNAQQKSRRHSVAT